jgi:hypothetical protein
MSDKRRVVERWVALALIKPVPGDFWPVLFGLVLWGVGYATQDTLLKAIIAGVLPGENGVWHSGCITRGYGGGWLIGSVIAG